MFKVGDKVKFKDDEWVTGIALMYTSVPGPHTVAEVHSRASTLTLADNKGTWLVARFEPWVEPAEVAPVLRGSYWLGYVGGNAPPKPLKFEPGCECGAHKVGVRNHQPGHSSWCPVK